VGQADITGETGEGLYTVSLDYGTSEVADRVARIDAEIADIEIDIATNQATISAQQSELSALKSALDVAIAEYRASNGDSKDDLNAASVAVSSKSQLIAGLRKDVAFLNLTKTNLLQKKAQLQAIATTETRSAWCVDYTLDASGSVETIEINGEQPNILIAPEASSPKGDKLRHRLAMPGAATYYNAAILPGWQKWKPTYRIGTVTDIDRENDKCTVNLSEAGSSAQGLEINQTDVLFDVPIEYMTCNSAAFDDGDEVVVLFDGQDWENPKVIGFRSNPKPCGPTRIILPVELVGTVDTNYYPTAKIAASIMETDVQHTPCVGGQYQTRETTPRPPGYRFAGQVQNATNSIVTLRPHFSSLGIYASNSRRGGYGGFAFNTDYTIAGTAPAFSNQAPADALTTRFYPRPLGGFQFEDVTNITLKNSDTTIDQYEALLYNVSFVTADIEGNDATVQCISDFMATRITGVPSTITVTPTGGGSIVYEFYRYFEGLDGTIPGYTDMPTTFGGMGLGYRLR